MIESAIRLILTNVPAIMFVLAFVVAAATDRGSPSRAEHYLGWLLLLSVGVDIAWAGLFHVFAPNTAAGYIGWQVSPFQFEIGVADIAIGIVAIASFWCSLEFKAAVVAYIVLFLAGVVYGHIHQAIAAGNFAPGNFGILLLLSIVKPFILVALLVKARRDKAAIR